MQIITYDHWLPYILGKHGMKLLGSYKKYDAKIDATIANGYNKNFSRLKFINKLN
jgi:hypothetical protein